jgi:cell division transport system permease protein
VSAFWHKLRFFVGDAWEELRHSPGVNLLAVGTLIAVLFGAGLITLVLSNVETFVAELRDDVRIELYLQDGVSEERREALHQELSSIEGVTRVEHIDKQEALTRYQDWAGEMSMLIDGLDSNPLPESLEVFLAPGLVAETVGSKIYAEFSNQEGVEQVRFDRELLGRIEAMLDLARIGGSGLGLLILGAVVFVMASVLRLAVYARRDEIEIMLLVGATPSFVRGPFLVAGMAQGLISSLVALALIEAARRAALGYAGDGSLALFDLLLAHALPNRFVFALITVGLAVSCIAAWFAVRHSQGLRKIAG